MKEALTEGGRGGREAEGEGWGEGTQRGGGKRRPRVGVYGES